MKYQLRIHVFLFKSVVKDCSTPSAAGNIHSQCGTKANGKQYTLKLRVISVTG